MLGPMVFTTIGDEYDKKDTKNSRFSGKNMMTTSCAHRGFVGDSCFQKKVLSLAEDDRYVDPGYYEKRYRIENERKKVVPQGFRYSNPSHKSTGAGDYFGTFSEKGKYRFEYITPEDPTKAAAGGKGKTLSMEPNIKANPPKRGTYGFPGLTIGGQIKYVSDPFDGAKRAEALATKSAKVAGPPFKAACRYQDYFDETAHGVAKIYTIDKPLPAKKGPGDAASATRARQAGPSWRPGGVLVKEITKAVAYQEDPYELREKKVRDERLKREQRFKPGQTWKPIGGSKSLPVRPIKFYPGSQ